MRPLSTHAIHELREIQAAPKACSSINPGVINRLLTEHLVRIVQLPSPFRTHRRRLVAHLAITEAGVDRLVRPVENDHGSSGTPQ